MIPSRGKHREFAQVSTQQSLRSSATHAERRSRTAPFHSSPSVPFFFLLSPFHLFGISLFPSGSPICLLLVPCIFSVFSASSRWNVTTFAKAFDLDAGGWRRGRRIRIKRTDCRKLVENPDEIREPPRCRAASFLSSPASYPSVVVRSAPRCLFLFLFSPLPQPRVLSRSSMPVPHPSPVSLNFITARRRPVSRCNMIVANEKVAKRENRLRVTNVD